MDGLANRRRRNRERRNGGKPMGKDEIVSGTPRALWYKILRGTVAMVSAGALSKIQHDPKWLWLIPVIGAVGKAIRQVKPGWAWIIPI